MVASLAETISLSFLVVACLGRKPTAPYYVFIVTIIRAVAKSTRDIEKLPNVNSSVGKPEAERAATGADGPGTGITGIFLSIHNLA